MAAAADRSLVSALKKIAVMRRAADSRELAAATLADYEKKQKRADLRALLERLPSNRPLVSHSKDGEKATDTQARLYREAMGK